MSNKKVADELHKAIIWKSEKGKILIFIDNIWGADLADMELISKFHKGFRFLPSVIGIYNKYEWVFL